jgi:hypothetical protein
MLKVYKFQKNYSQLQLYSLKVSFRILEFQSLRNMLAWQFMNKDTAESERITAYWGQIVST